MKLSHVFGALLLGGVFFSLSSRAQDNAPDVTNLVTATTNLVTVTTNVVTVTSNVVTTTANVVTTTTNVIAETTNQIIEATNTVTDTADLIIYNARVVTVNSDFAVDQAIAVRDGWILGVGKDRQLEKFRGPETLMIDAKGRMVMPGLYDAHVNSYVAAVSELNGPLPAPDSIEAAQDYIRKRAAKTAPGTWIVLEQLYPTRLREGRLPTKAELDAATTNHPVCWNFGPMAVVNSKALEVSRITKATPDPRGGEVEKDPKHLNPTGLLRNAMSLVKIPPSARPPTPAQRREALKRLYQLYNQQGITSIGEERAEPDAIDLFRELSRAGELTVRINCARVLDILANVDDTITKLDTLTNAPAGKLPYGPTGVGNDWVRIGPLKTILDGDVAVGTAYLRTPYGIGPTFKITEPAYRGELKPDPYVLPDVLLEAAQRGWQLSTHCAGDAALDMALNCYEQIQFKLDIHERRFLISHNDFQADQDWTRCLKLGVGADLQPGCLYEDGSSLLTMLGEKRLQNFVPLKSWFDRGLVVGGGSEHTARLDSRNAAGPWNPWLGMWVTLTRQTSQGDVINPEEKLTREQAIRFYTVNNAWLNFEDKRKGSLEPGKYADLVMIDRDILKCPVDDIRDTKVLLTVVNGKIVWESKPAFQLDPEITSVTVTNMVTNFVVTNVLATTAMTNQAAAIAATNLTSTIPGANGMQTAAPTGPAPAGTLANQNPAVTVTNQAATVTVLVTNQPPAITVTNLATTVVVTNFPSGPAASNTATTIMVSVTVTNQLPAEITATNSTAISAPVENMETAAVTSQPAIAPVTSTATIASDAVNLATNQAVAAPLPETVRPSPVANATPNEAAPVASTVQPAGTAAPNYAPSVDVLPPGTLVVRARTRTNTPVATVAVTNQTAAVTSSSQAAVAVTNQPAPAAPTATNQVVDPMDWSHLMGGSKTPH